MTSPAVDPNSPAPADPSGTVRPPMPPSLPPVRRARFQFWKTPRGLRLCTAAAVMVLAIVFGAISYRASLTKSATYDEPLHVVGGFVHRYFNDYRINPEDPALFGLWAA